MTDTRLQGFTKWDGSPAYIDVGRRIDRIKNRMQASVHYETLRFDRVQRMLEALLASLEHYRGVEVAPGADLMILLHATAWPLLTLEGRSFTARSIDDGKFRSAA